MSQRALPVGEDCFGGPVCLQALLCDSRSITTQTTCVVPFDLFTHGWPPPGAMPTGSVLTLYCRQLPDSTRRS